MTWYIQKVWNSLFPSRLNFSEAFVTELTFLPQGDDLLRSRKIAFPFYQTFKPDPSDSELLVENELIECSIDKEPTHPKPGTYILSTLGVSEPGLTFAGVTTKNCRLKSDLSSIPKELFKRMKQEPYGGEYWELHYKLLVSIESGPMVFSLEIGGKEYGQVLADY